jgi:hypothetical protein
MNKKYNNLLATSMVQGIKAKLHSRPAFVMLPQSNLKQKINDGCDAWHVIEARRRAPTGTYHDDDDSDCFPAFTSNIINKSYPKEFKPVGIPKYDGK